MDEQKLRKRIKAWIIVFIVGLVLSGITAFPIETELTFLVRQSYVWPDFMANGSLPSTRPLKIPTPDTLI